MSHTTTLTKLTVSRENVEHRLAVGDRFRKNYWNTPVDRTVKAVTFENPFDGRPMSEAVYWYEEGEYDFVNHIDGKIAAGLIYVYGPKDRLAIKVGDWAKQDRWDEGLEVVDITDEAVVLDWEGKGFTYPFVHCEPEKWLKVDPPAPPEYATPEPRPVTHTATFEKDFSSVSAAYRALDGAGFENVSVESSHGYYHNVDGFGWSGV